jgi:hypothetical protein
MGPLLFTLALVAIVFGPLVGLVWGPTRIIVHRLRGLDLSPPVDTTTRPVSLEEPVVALKPGSMLTQRSGRGGVPDPLVCLDGVDYRITRVAPERYLVTERRESRRLGFFEIVGDPDQAEIAPEPDEPGKELLLIRIAVAASHASP